MLLSHGLPARDGVSSSGHRRPARHPGNRSPFGKPGHPPRRRRPWLVRPLAPLDGSPAQGDHVRPCPRFSRIGQAATPHRSDPFPAQAIGLAVGALAEVPGHLVPSDPSPHGLHVKTAASPRPVHIQPERRVERRCRTGRRMPVASEGTRTPSGAPRFCGPSPRPRCAHGTANATGYLQPRNSGNTSLVTEARTDQVALIH